MRREGPCTAAIRSSSVRDLLCWSQSCQQRIALPRSFQRDFSGAGEPVILTRWPLFGVRDRLALPLGSNQLLAFHPAQRGVDSSAWKASRLHHRVAINMTCADGLQDHRRTVGESWPVRHAGSVPYVEVYLARGKSMFSNSLLTRAMVARAAGIPAYIQNRRQLLTAPEYS